MYIATRNEDRANAAIEDLKQTIGKEAVWLKLDLASLESVKAAAEEFLGCVRSDFRPTTDLKTWLARNQNFIFFSTTRAFPSPVTTVDLDLVLKKWRLWDTGRPSYR